MTACVTVVIAAQVIALLFGGILVSLGDFLMCERLLLSSHVVLFFFLFLPCSSFSTLVSYSC